MRNTYSLFTTSRKTERMLLLYSGILLLCCINCSAQILEGKKYQDDNCNGIYDAGEQGLPNWQIQAYNPATATTMTVWTDPTGDYQCAGLTPGTWVVSEYQQLGWYQTGPNSVFYTVTVIPGQIISNLNFGNRPLCTGTINTPYTAGVLDNYDPGNGSEPSTISSELTNVIASLTPAPIIAQFDYTMPMEYAFGHTFANLDTAGCCIVGATLHICLSALAGGNSNNDIIGFAQGNTVVWSDSIKNLVAPPGTWMAPRQDCLTLDLGNLSMSAAGITSIIAALQDGTLDVFVYDNTSVDYMELEVQYCCPAPPTGNIHGAKYHDLNANGIRDAGEPALQGWVITAHHLASDTTLADTTNANGMYSFTTIPTGEWIISENQQSGWVQTAPFSVAHRSVLATSQTVSALDFGNTTTCAEPLTIISSAGNNEDITIISNEPDAELITYMESIYEPGAANQASGFNDPQPNKIFGHTFNGFRQPNCYIVGAFVTLQITTNGSGSNDDSFGFVQGTTSVWRAHIGDVVGGTWNNSTATVVLNLANLPTTIPGWSVTTNIIAALQDGDIDFFVEDNTTVRLAQLTLDFCCLYTEIEGTKYYDIDGNGVQSSDEPGLSGWIIKARNNRTGEVVIDTTDGIGNYSLSLSTTGTWKIFEMQQPTWTQTDPPTVLYTVPVPTSPALYGFYFGNKQTCADTLWEDTVGVPDNFNNIDTNEITSPSTELQNVLDSLYPAILQTHSFDDPASNKAIGHTFSGLPTQGKISRAILKVYIRTTHAQSTNDRIYIIADGVVIWSAKIGNLLGYTWQNSTDSLILDLTNLPGTGVSNVVGALQDGDFDFYIQDDTQIDYAILATGMCSACTPHGIKFHDINNNGVYDEGTDSTMSGWEIRAYNLLTNQEDTVFTDANGWYIFPALPAGTWEIYEVQQSGWVQTFPTSVFYHIVGASGQVIGGVDFGNTLQCSSPTSTSATVGVNDNFSTAGGSEHTSPGTSLQALLDSLYAPSHQSTLLDASQAEEAIGHTFTGFLPTGCKLVDAQLTLHLRTTSNPLVINDRINIVANGGIIWAASISSLVGGTWQNAAATIVLNLDSMPGPGAKNLMAALQDGTLSFFIQDDTQMDYATLEAWYCCPPYKNGAGEQRREWTTTPRSVEARAIPNPFGGHTNFQIAVQETTTARLTVYDVFGNLIRTFDIGKCEPGQYVVRWDGTNASGVPVANGTYIYRIETPTFRRTEKVVLQR